jgi:hypothetical protein
MQVLITTGTVAGTQPIYLPYDKAPVPFGDPLAATLTAATPTVVTVPGYAPTRGDAVAFSPSNGFLTSLSGTLSTIGIVGNTTYYVTSVSGDTFSLTTQKAAAVDYPLSSITTGGNNINVLATQALQPFVHLLSNQPDGPTIPFKPNNTVLAMNGGFAGAIATGSAGYGAITLMGAPDMNTTLATGSYGAPLGPSTFAVIATIGFGTPKLVTLSSDWIVASGSTATLILLQN